MQHSQCRNAVSARPLTIPRPNMAEQPSGAWFQRASRAQQFLIYGPFVWQMMRSGRGHRHVFERLHLEESKKMRMSPVVSDAKGLRAGASKPAAAFLLAHETSRYFAQHVRARSARPVEPFGRADCHARGRAPPRRDWA